MTQSYQVTLKPVSDTEVGGLQFLSLLPNDAILANDCVGSDDNYNDIYQLEVEDEFSSFTENQLDLSEKVISWRKVTI